MLTEHVPGPTLKQRLDMTSLVLEIGRSSLTPSRTHAAITVGNHAFSRFPLLMGTHQETDDETTALFGFSPVSDVTWVRVLNQPTSGAASRYFFNHNDDPYHVARQLNGDFVLFWRDMSLTTEPYAMLNFGPNDPS